MAQNGTDLAPEQLRAIRALVEHGDKTRAAKSAGIGRTTLWRWLREDKAFQAALDEAMAEALREFSQALVRLSAGATQTLEDALSPTQDINVRLRAAVAVMGRLLQVREAVELEERVAELEAALHE